MSSTAKVPQAPDGPARAGLYVRVSTRKQADEGQSLPEQQRRGRAYVEARGWTIGGVYSDAESGRHDDRPGLAQLLADAEARRLDVVVIPKIDRFGRDFRHSAEIKGRLEDAGVGLVAMDLGVDFSTGPGLLLWATLSSVAQMESERIGERVAFTAEAHARAGKVYGGTLQYGYRRRAPRGIEPDPAQAPIAVRIFDEAAAGMTQGEICAGLNRDGVPSAKGGEWHRANIGRMLRSPVYYGGVTYKGEVVHEAGDHEALVTRECWDRARAQVEARNRQKGNGGGRRPTDRHLLTRGLLRCGRCGGAMQARSHAKGTGTYFCARHLSHGLETRCWPKPFDRAVVDAAVLDFFTRVGFDLDATKRAYAEHVGRHLATARALRESAEREAATASSNLRRVRADYKAGALSADDWADFGPEMAAELEAADASAEQARAAESAAIEAAELRDVEEHVLRALAELRASIATEVVSGSNTAAVRLAVARLFTSFELHDVTGFANPPRSGPTHVLAEGEGVTYWILPRVRADALAGVNQLVDGLKPVPLTLTVDPAEQPAPAG